MNANPESTASVSRERVASNAVIYSISQVLTWIVSFLTLSIVPRYLGEEVMGKIAIAGTVSFTFTTALSFSIEKYLIAEVARATADAERVVRAMYGIRSIAVPLMALCSLYILKTRHYDALTVQLGIVLIIYNAIFMVNEPFRSILAGWEDAKRVAIVDVVWAFGGFVSIPLVIFGPVAWQSSAVVTSSLIMIYRVFYVRKYISLKPLYDFKLWKRIVLGAGAFYVVDLVVAAYAASSVFILKHYTDNDNVGVYSQAMKLQGTFLFIPTAIGTALLPSLTRIATASSDEFKAMQKQVMGIMVVLGLPVGALVYMLAGDLTYVLYGHHKFQQLPAVLQAVAFNLIPLYVSSMLYQFLVAQRKNGVWSIFLLVTVGINFWASNLLVPYFKLHYHNGAVGAVAAVVIAEIATTIMAIIILKNVPVDIPTLIRMGKAILATAIMVAVMKLTDKVFFVVPMTLGIAVFTFLGWKMRLLGAEEQAKLEELFRRKLKLKNKNAAQP